MAVAFNVDYDYLLKVVLIGDSGVGKSALLRRLAHNEFVQTHMTTIGVDFEVLTRTTSNGKVVKLQIWDTAGQERFQTITSSYYRGAHAVMIVCDVTNAETVHNVTKWCCDFRQYNKECHNIMLVGNKMDQEQMRQVSFEELENLARDLQLELEPVQTSALAGNASVNEAIDRLVEHTCASRQFTKDENRVTSNSDSSAANIDLSQKTMKKTLCCSLI